MSLTITFEKKAAGAANYVTMFTANQTTSPTAGVVNFDTGFQNFTPPPGQGDQYRIRVGGTYTLGGPPPQTKVLPTTGSPTVTPVP